MKGPDRLKYSPPPEHLMRPVSPPLTAEEEELEHEDEEGEENGEERTIREP